MSELANFLDFPNCFGHLMQKRPHGKGITWIVKTANELMNNNTNIYAPFPKLSKRTIENWRVSNPKNEWKLLVVCHIADWSKADTDRLLELAYFPSLRELYEQATPPQKWLLEKWISSPITESIDIEVAIKRLKDLPLNEIPPVHTLPKGSRLLYAPNPHFVGRQEELHQLAKAMRSDATTVAIHEGTVATTGLGGMGKTQLAVEFAHRYGTYFMGGVYWINCAERTAIPSEIGQCGEGMNLHPDFTNLDAFERQQFVERAWREPIPRLLIFDNLDIDAEEILDEYRPNTGGCRVLITSRRQEWSPVLGMNTIPLSTFTPAQSVQLLKSLASRLNEDDAMQVAVALDHFPLALHIAGCFLDLYNNWSTTQYIDRLEAQPLDHLERRLDKLGRSPTAHELSVARTFAISWERLEAEDETDRLAQTIFQHIAWCAPGEPFPIELLPHTLTEDERITAWWNGLEDMDRMDTLSDGLRRLNNLGLLERPDDIKTIVIHRLLTAYGQQLQENETTRTAVETGLLHEADRQNDTGYPATLRTWSLHLSHIIVARREIRDELSSELMQTLGYHFDQDGLYDLVLPLYKKSLAIRRDVLGTRHSDTATALNNLAEVYESMGEYEKALPLYEESRAIYREVLGARHYYTATVLNNLALLYQKMGDYEEALPLYEESLAISQDELGAKHPDTAIALSNLAGLYESMGEYKKGLPLYEESLTIFREGLGAKHPDTGTALNNLAESYEKMGEYEKALSLYEESLAISQEELGARHPDTAQSFNNMGGLYERMGEYKKALPLHEESLAIRREVLGVRHPETADSLNNLALLYQKMGEHEKALSLYEKSLAISEDVLGEWHPDTVSVLNNLAGLYTMMEEYEKAELLYEESLAIRREMLGEKHPDTAHSLNNLARLYEKMGEYEEAFPLYEGSLTIFREVLGEEHPDTAIVLNNLGDLYERMGEYEKALSLYEESLPIYSKVLGVRHPTITTMLNNMAFLYVNQGDWQRAEPLMAQVVDIFVETLGENHPQTQQSQQGLMIIQSHLK